MKLVSSGSQMPLKYLFRKLAALLVAFAGAFLAGPAMAANCYYATAQGSTGPTDWQTYCWLDFSGYVDSAARSAAGQNFTYNLPDGTVMSFNLKASGSAFTSAVSPAWGGAAVGNTAFTGIAGRPILYQTVGGTTTVTISAIALTPPASGAVSNFMFVAADAESSNESESLSFTTNGGAWQMLDQAGPIVGSAYPTYSGIGTSTFTENGTAGTVGAYVVGSTSPTQVVGTLVGGGLQGMMFAVRFASIRLNTKISGARADPTDQFRFSIAATGTGTILASGTSTGSGLGPFTAAALSSTSAIPLTLKQAMAAGSASALSRYQSRLSCTNAISTSTPLPVNVTTTSYDFGTLQFGDAVQCTFTEMPFPQLRLSKTLAATGRQFAADQFVMNITQGATVVATTTTTGTGATIANGVTPQYQAIPGTAYGFGEVGAGGTSLTQYTVTMSCTNAASGTGTVLPSVPGGTITPKMGDVISCVITNTKRALNATLVVAKQAQALSDPVNGSANPKMIPGAVARYSIVVQNTGPSTVDGNSILIVDSLPGQITVGSASAPAITQGATASGLTLNSATDVRYSNGASAPTSFAQCGYAPVAAYDPAVRFVCINPKGIMAGSTGSHPGFTVTFNSLVN